MCEIKKQQLYSNKDSFDPHRGIHKGFKKNSSTDYPDLRLLKITNIFMNTFDAIGFGFVKSKNNSKMCRQMSVATIHLAKVCK